MKKNYFAKEYIHYIIALIIGVSLLTMLPVTGILDEATGIYTPGLTILGRRVIAVLIPTLYLWLTTNTHWTSLMSLGLLVITEAMTPNEVWANSMGHFVVITIICYSLLNVALKDTGVINKVALFFITRKFVKGRPYAFMGMFFASSLIIGMFMDNMSLAVIYIGIAATLCEQINLKKGEKFYTSIFLGILLTNVLYSICSPIAHSLPNVIMGLAETQLGIEITYVQWFMYGIPFAAIMFPVLMLAIRIMNPDTSKFKNFDIDEVKKNDPPLTRSGMIASAIFTLCIIMVVLPTMLKGLPGNIGRIASFWYRQGTVIPAMLAVVALGIIKKADGKPILDVPKGFKELPLPAIIFAGTVCCYAVPISSPATGIKSWLSGLFAPMVNGQNPVVTVIILMTLAIFITNFLSNTVTMVLFFNIGAALLAGGNVSLAIFTVLISFAASMATVTPSASVPSPLFFGEGYINMKDTLKSNITFVAIAYAILIFSAIALL